MRALCVTLGAVWAGVAYAARNGNPYVMAVFALIYMLPMLYRFTQSSHPVSMTASWLTVEVELIFIAFWHRGMPVFQRHFPGTRHG